MINDIFIDSVKEQNTRSSSIRNIYLMYVSDNEFGWNVTTITIRIFWGLIEYYLPDEEIENDSQKCTFMILTTTGAILDYD